MLKIFKIISLSIFVTLVTSCSSEISDYQKTDPKFDIKNYFTGEFIAFGMVQDYSNQVTRRFCVELNGTWNNNQGQLAEVFYFDDGEVSYRTWQLTKQLNDEYTGSAEDVVGIAKGKQSGFAFHWQYELLVPIEGEAYSFDMDDWMYQIDENRVFNRTTMNKFGVKVAEITLFFDKNTPSKQCQIPQQRN
ncbi:MAG: hypothetical protein ACJAXJ_003738 [Colwellia sp.]|jgi:hypothetical protein|tara:strand:- start:15005 stop:15574 length:570 start_codon:yes stop_codon:yes gene_type:complete